MEKKSRSLSGRNNSLVLGYQVVDIFQLNGCTGALTSLKLASYRTGSKQYEECCCFGKGSVRANEITDYKNVSYEETAKGV